MALQFATTTTGCACAEAHYVMYRHRRTGMHLNVCLLRRCYGMRRRRHFVVVATAGFELCAINDTAVAAKPLKNA